MHSIEVASVEVDVDDRLDLVERVDKPALALSPIKRQAVGLGAARWRNVSPEDRSEALRKAARARWEKHRKKIDEKGEGRKR